MQSTELKNEINSNTLSLIENALWSMRALVCETEEMNMNIKKEYDEIFYMLLNRFERLSNILESETQSA